MANATALQMETAPPIIAARSTVAPMLLANVLWMQIVGRTHVAHWEAVPKGYAIAIRIRIAPQDSIAVLAGVMPIETFSPDPPAIPARSGAKAHHGAQDPLKDR